MGGYGMPGQPVRGLQLATASKLKSMAEGNEGFYNVMKSLQRESSLKKDEMPSQLDRKLMGTTYGLSPGVGNYNGYQSNYGTQALERAIQNGAHMTGSFDHQNPMDLGGDPKYALNFRG